MLFISFLICFLGQCFHSHKQISLSYSVSENFAYRYHSYHAGHQARYEILLGMDCFTKGRVQKKKKKKVGIFQQGGEGPENKKKIPTFPKTVPFYLECHDSARNVIKFFWPYVVPPPTTTTNSAAALHRSLCSWKLAYVQQF